MKGNSSTKYIGRASVFVVLFTPFFAAAAVTDFKGFIEFAIDSFVKPTTGFIMSLAIVYFLWSVMLVVKDSDNQEVVEKFKTRAMWGVIALAAMVSMWGLVNFVTGSLDMNTDSENFTIPGM